ncbi:MAG: four helix bundle protein [Kiritimatiellae bacterium]|nr:four helix bundle protein [Kiritimatiellia bacterium]
MIVGVQYEKAKIHVKHPPFYGRHHHQENIQFCRIARGSLSETLDHLNTALDEEYLSDKDYGELRSMLSDTWKVLNGFIAYLKKCAADGVQGSE